MDIKRRLIYKHIGAKVAYYRTINEISQEELATRAHTTRSTLSRIENGKNDNLSIDLLIDIADGLGVDLCMLVAFDENEKLFWQKKFDSHL